jgi:hypothetical protein
MPVLGQGFLGYLFSLFPDERVKVSFTLRGKKQSRIRGGIIS